MAIFAFGANANDETKQLAAMIRKAKETDTLFILLLKWYRMSIVNSDEPEVKLFIVIKVKMRW